ncbi:unnamed protein product [Didymodactylos carnosus]|uniref:alpha-amylase n=2 Tax=Didymodactylos carnosus TaxID=1234261 RepID=A0A815P3M6_9BILA|nr:unnamed protein product [Didymodactylos carnosus]CAF4319087.1 unnamed protein product [Didymodactylos carnosus]
MGPNINDTAQYIPFNQDIHYHQPLCYITDYSNQTQVELCTVGDPDVPLPDLNTEHPFVVNALNQWIENITQEYSFDAIRIDTFRHIRKEFWTNFTAASRVYSVGEVATSETDYVGSYQNYTDGMLQFPLFFVLNQVFRDQGRQSIRELKKQVELNEQYFKDTTLCGVFLDNHDQQRFLNHTITETLIRNALTFLMFNDGIPIVYYGTEQGFEGNPEDTYGYTDPWNREPLWTSNYSQSHPIYQFIKQLNSLRAVLKAKYPGYFTTHQQTVYLDDSTYIYYKNPVTIVISNGEFDTPKRVNITVNMINSIDFFTNKKITDQQLIVNSWAPMIIIPENMINSAKSLSCTTVLFLLFVVLVHAENQTQDYKTG